MNSPSVANISPGGKGLRPGELQRRGGSHLSREIPRLR
ncbi:hypothetical protein L21SP2_2325 [Salinispira pacifica]|uniref:Uncharacterized protein n=1 Tax=Salinispira pacifica TaxID=1307761 RepID=V5WIM5_9SPIO|nr:hypothetical protein L21SP2_2325 [Salinispira pacifica]